MDSGDFAALEQVEAAAFIDFFRAAPQPMRAAHHVRVRQMGDVSCLGCTRIEPGIIFRRVLGLGSEALPM